MNRRNRAVVWWSALLVALFEVVGSFGAAANQPDRKGLDALAVVLVLVGPLGLAVRDRWPLVAVGSSVASAAVYVGLGYPYGPIFVSIVIALLSAVLAGRRWGAWSLAGLGYVAFVVASALDGRAKGTGGLVHDSLVAGWLVVVLAVAELVRARRDTMLQRAVVEREQRQRRDGEQRLQLAQELHDVLAHHISLINVQAGVALHLIDSHPERARPALTEIKTASRAALGELRSALEILRNDTAPLSPTPRLADLERLVATVRASGLDVRLDEGPRPALAATVEAAVYRIVQEALTNVSRHAQARGAVVRIGYDGEVTVEVQDDGIGGPSTAGTGITGMRERAGALGGSVEAGPHPAGGFRVVAHLPIGAR